MVMDTLRVSLRRTGLGMGQDGLFLVPQSEFPRVDRKRTTAAHETIDTR